MSIVYKWREAQGVSFRVALTGDFCPYGPGSSRRVADNAAALTAAIRPVFDAVDLRLMQWETAITDKASPIDKCGPNLASTEEAIAFARELKIDVNLLANNHVGDFGAAGVIDTLAACQKNGIAGVGAGKDAVEAAKPLLLEVKGFKLAVVNRCEHEFGVARPAAPGTAGIDMAADARLIRQLKAAGNLVLVALHGGHETLPFPSPRMVDLFRFYADCGADAVFNCHTHCALGCEIYNNVPVVGSPGNFYFQSADGQLREFPTWHFGYVPVYSFDAAGAFKLELFPYLNVVDGVKPLDDADEAWFKEYFKILCRPFEDRELCQRIFDQWSRESTLDDGYFTCLYAVAAPADWNDRQYVQSMLCLRDLFTCEAHYDMLRNVFYLMEQYRMAPDQEMAALIKECRFPEYMKQRLQEYYKKL